LFDFRLLKQNRHLADMVDLADDVRSCGQSRPCGQAADFRFLPTTEVRGLSTAKRCTVANIKMLNACVASTD
jgi:hypothetical protein